MTVGLSPRLDAIKDRLACPACHGDLAFTETDAQCAACRAQYPIKNGKIYFITPFAVEDALDSIKSFLKHKLHSLYYTIGIPLFAPVYPFNYPKALRPFFDFKNALFVDLGSGDRRIAPEVITLDATDYKDADIIADVKALPFKDGSIDAFGSRGLLEHIPAAHEAASEIKRCTKAGGISAHQIPFLFPYHASPHDYQRYTHTGAAHLFEGWEVLDQRGTAGPVSLILLTVTETLSIVLSFGHQKLQAPLYLALCLLLFPLKILDAPFVGRRAFLSLATSILTVVQKPKGG